MIFWRELRDQLRDRRTLFVVVVLPLVFYPLMAVGLVRLTDQFEKQERVVGINHWELLPDHPQLFDKSTGAFNPEYFDDIPEAKETFIVDTSRPWTSADLESGRLDVLIDIPPDAKQKWTNGETVTVNVLRDGRRDRSAYSYRFLHVVLRQFGRAYARENMINFGHNGGYAHPILVDKENGDVTPSEERSGSTWGRIIPFFLVIMALTGAFYPAIDLVPGEKERGTMESLLLSPASRMELVVAKYLTILTFSLVTVTCNLISVCITMLQVASVVPETEVHTAERLAPAETWMMGVSLLMVIPLASFFAALCLTLATFARTTKEGQHYLMPLFMVVTPLTAVTLAPGVELSPATSLIPVTNVGLLIRSLLINQYDQVLQYFLPVMLLTILYCYLALTLAVDQFQREGILFGSGQREAGQVGEKTPWFARRDLPTTGWAALGWLIAVLFSNAAHYLTASPQTVVPWWVLGAVIPPLVLAVLVTREPTKALGLNQPSGKSAVILALVLAVLACPAAASLRVRLQASGPTISDLASVGQALLWVLLPTLCLEIALRGFLLHGLRDRLPAARSILLAALMATAGGFESLSPLIVLITSIVLGLVVTRTGSIWLAFLIHASWRTGWLLPSIVTWPDSLAMFTIWALGISLLTGWLTKRPAISPKDL